MNDDYDPLIRRLADANPVPPDEVEAAGRSAKADRILARATAPVRASLTEDHGRNVRRWVAVGVVLFVTLVAASALVRMGREAPETASEVLHQTANVAAHRAATAGEGDYVYAKTAAERLTTFGEGAKPWSAVIPALEESWIAADGSGRIRSVVDAVKFLGPRDVDRWRAAGSPEFETGMSEHTFSPGELSFEDLSLLPTDLSALRDILREHVVAEDLPVDVGMFLRAGELLARGDASPELRAALYTLVAELPGIELVGEIADPVGRRGTAIGMDFTQTGAAVRGILIVDEVTSVLLAEELVLLERAEWVDAEPGTRLSFIAYLESGRTDSIQ